MKTPDFIRRPSLTCRLVRVLGFWGSGGDKMDFLDSLDSLDGEGSRFVRRHLANCGCCQEYFRAAQKLERSLGAAARGLQEEVSPFLEPRIVHALRRSQAPVVARSGFPWSAILAGGVAAGVAGIFWLGEPPPTPALPPPAPSPGLFSAISKQPIDFKLWSLLPSATEDLLNANPLQQEADAVYADARSAVSRGLAVGSRGPACRFVGFHQLFLGNSSG